MNVCDLPVYRNRLKVPWLKVCNAGVQSKILCLVLEFYLGKFPKLTQYVLDIIEAMQQEDRRF